MCVLMTTGFSFNHRRRRNTVTLTRSILARSPAIDDEVGHRRSQDCRRCVPGVALATFPAAQNCKPSGHQILSCDSDFPPSVPTP